MNSRSTPATALDDADLARRIASGGDAAAAEAELCRRYVRRLYLFGLRHLAREDLAHDLAQDALVVTLEKLRSNEVRDPERIGPFILGVARLLTRSGGRERARHQPLDDAADSSLPAVDAAPPDPLAREQVARCLGALQERQRAVIVLTYYAEQSTEEIASSLGLTANNVRVIRHRGIAGLRTCLGLEQGEAA